MSLSQSLAKLLEKMGGGAPDAPAGGEEAILAEIAETYDPESGIELPKVTADDNGKVLGVVNGAWNKADRQVVTTTAQIRSSFFEADSVTFDKSFSEIYTALEQGKDVIFRIVQTIEGTSSTSVTVLLLSCFQFGKTESTSKVDYFIRIVGYSNLGTATGRQCAIETTDGTIPDETPLTFVYLF